MAWQLTEEVQQYAPDDLTLADRAVLLAIAAEARIEHRRATLDRDELARRAGLTAKGVRGVLRRLRDRGLEVRVPIPGRTDSLGRPVYAIPGSVVTYQLPVFAPPAAVEQLPQPVDNPEDKGALGGPPGALRGHEGGPGRTGKGALGGPPSPYREPVGAPAPAREEPAPAVDNPAPPVPVATRPPEPRLECPRHADLPPDQPRPGCRDCAELRRAQASRRTELARAEARARRRCTSCDELGWVLGPDGHAAEPGQRCRHPDLAAPPGRRTNRPAHEKATVR